jgi:hypothetical protein
MLWWTALYTTKLIHWDTSAYSPKYSRQRHHWFMAAPCAELWTVENTPDWMDKTPTSTHDLSVWSSSSLGRWHPRSSVLLVLTRHSSLILNEWWTRVINLSMFFLLCYNLTTILRSRALHRVLSLAIQYAWCPYMLCRLYRKVKTFRRDLLTTYYMQAIQQCMHRPPSQDRSGTSKLGFWFIFIPDITEWMHCVDKAESIWRCRITCYWGWLEKWKENESFYLCPVCYCSA